MNTLKVLILTMVMVVGISAGSIFAQELETSGSASMGVFSNYVWRGFKLSDGAVIQPSVGITYGSFGANLWANYDTDTNEHNETDLTLTYGFSMDKLSLEVGYIYYALDGLDDTQELYVSAGYETLLNPSITLYYDFDEGDGAFLTASIGHSLELTGEMAIDLGASVSYNLNSEYSIGDYSAFHNGEISASMSIPLGRNVSLDPVIAFTFPLSDDAEDSIEAISVDGDSSIFYGGITLSVSF